MATNKETGDKGEQIVIDYFRSKGIKAEIVKHRTGYDIKAGNKLIEVKTTGQTVKQKTYFLLTQNEFFTACKNRNYCIYWVDVKNKKIVLELSRNEILKNSHPTLHYRVYLSKLKKKI